MLRFRAQSVCACNSKPPLSPHVCYFLFYRLKKKEKRKPIIDKENNRYCFPVGCMIYAWLGFEVPLVLTDQSNT